MKQSVSDILKNFDKEQRYLFSSSDIWTNTYKSSSDYSDYLFPHSKSYDSLLNPMFLHELKSKESLCLFKQVLVRDGLLGAIVFFRENPSPAEGMDTVLYINKNLISTVPAAWRAHCDFYENIKLDLDNKHTGTPQVYIVFNESEDFSSQSEYEKKIEMIFEYFDKKDEFPNVIFVPINRNFLIKEDSCGGSLSLYRKLKTGLKYFPDSSCIKWESISELKVNNSFFMVANQNNFHISDDYIDFFFLSRGATPLDRNYSVNENRTIIQLSPFHGVSILDASEVKSLDKDFDDKGLSIYNREKYQLSHEGDSFLAPSEYLDAARELSTLRP